MRLHHLMLGATSACLSLFAAGTGEAATLFLKAGTFYGPGNKGVHPFNNAEVRNMIPTGPLSGVIPFFNNGIAAPNVTAEIRQGGIVDGKTSDGRLINENVDTGLQFVLKDRITGNVANIMVVAVGAEDFGPDAKGNLVFNTDVVADPGPGHLVTPLNVTFTTGAARVPLSLKTQKGLGGGNDHAGPFQTGHTLIGRIGDFDHDGLLDGELVLAGNSPLELFVAEGDPIAQRRPWVSDIPVTPAVSALLIVNGIVQNFPAPLTEVLQQRDTSQAVNYGFDITERLNAALYDLNSVLSAQSITRDQKRRMQTARLVIRIARFHIEKASTHSPGRTWMGIVSSTAPRR